MTTEHSLGDPNTGHAGEERGDLTLDEWIDGVRAYRLPVTVTLVKDDPTGERTQRLLDLADQNDALPDGPEVDALIEEAEALQSALVTRQTFVLEQRSRERRAETAKAALEAVGTDPDADDGKRTRTQALQIGIRVLLDQIVEPQGVTLAQLAAICEKAEDAADLLASKLDQVNAGATRSPVALRDFSKRGSRSRPTKAS